MGPGSSSAVAGNVAVQASSRAVFVQRWAAPLVALLTVGLLASDQGGYFPNSWGWPALATLWLLGVWLVVGARVDAGSLDVWLICAFAAFTVWVALSIIWSDSATQSVLELERAVLYMSALAAVLVLARRGGAQLLAAGVVTAIGLIALYSLSTRLFPDRLGVFDSFSGYRLSEPIGYSNGLGILLGIGVLLAIGFAARAPYLAGRLVAAASLAILIPTLYFTFSRGAWIALGIGCACAFAYDPRRLQLGSTVLLVAPAPVIATLLAAHSPALTHARAPLADAVHDGHRLALALAFLVPATAFSALVGIFVERRLHAPRSVRLVYGAALLAIPLAAFAVGLARYGGPVDAVSRAYSAFKSPPVGQVLNLNKRLLSLTSNGRIDLWHVAWEDDFKPHSTLGSGAGTFARYWFQNRPVPSFNAQDAHELYLETLAELGPIGLALLVAGLIVPFVAAARARREPLAAFLLAAYIALLLHAGVDWDFELPAIGLAGLFCGAALIVAARETAGPRAWNPILRGGALTATVALAGFALLGLIGNSALSASDSARQDLNLTKAESQARKARRLMPWSAEPWTALGSAQYAQRDVRGARVSFRRAVKKDPGDWTLWLDLAAVAKGKERKDALAHARRLNPGSPEIRDLRSRLRQRASGP
ncbi:MAG TPA: O-antigen ligase family protein [Gaiellaceae bacterium]|nr:O-antigen ligase family protein [Gaiellaceae bacterium]